MTEPTPFREGEETPPRGVRTMAAVRWVILGLVALAAFSTVYSAAAPASVGGAAHQHGPKYYCPMHPEITSDVPGECPICHMTLELIPKERKDPARPKTPAPASASAPGSAAAPPSRPPPSGVVPVTLALDRIQAIGVRTEPVETSSSNEPLRVAAQVEAPEKSAAEVHVRTAGFLETLAVREVGTRVRAGQPLATIYSPDVFKAQQELLAVLDWKDTSGRAPVDEARRKLELLGVPRATIDKIVEKREAVRAFAVSSPIDGYVVRRAAVLGAFVAPEMPLFEIVGLERVYVVASVDPSVLSRIQIGDTVRFTTPSLPDRSFEAKVDLVYPVIDAVARAARVRFSLKNPDQELRPGLVGTAELTATPGSAETTVPLDAVLHTGREAYVFVAEGGGRYSPRGVFVGQERGERIVVRGDLRDGDRVVSRAAFLIDSESRLRASFARVEGAPPASSAGGQGGAPP